MQNTLQIARVMGTKCVFPVAVQRELAANWDRKLVEQSDGIEAAVRKLGGSLRAVGFGVPIFEHQTGIAEAYEAVVTQLLGSGNFVVVGYPTVSLERAFEEAIARTPPFQEQGKGFQDFVIYSSFVEYIQGQQDATGAFVSEDRAFDGIDSGPRVQIFKNLDAFQNVLKDDIEAALRGAWEDLRRLTAGVFDSRIAEVQEYIDQNLAISASSLGMWELPAKVNHVRVAGHAQNIQVPFSPTDDGSKVVPISADFPAEVSVTRRVYRQIPQAAVRIGEPAPPAWIGLVRSHFEKPDGEYEEASFSKVVRVQATGSRVNHYRDLSLTGVELMS